MSQPAALWPLLLGCVLPSPWLCASTPTVDTELRALLEQAIHEADSFADPFDAEVWLVDMSRRLTEWVPGTARRLELLRLVHREARRARLEPELVLAVIEVESAFDHYAISVRGARGLMQIMPFWLDEIGAPDANLFRLQTNLRMGCTILRHYLDKEDGNLSRALGRYNGTLNSPRYPNKVFQALAKRWYRQ